MLSRLIFLLGISGASIAAANRFEPASNSQGAQTGACSMRDSSLMAFSIDRLRRVVTDTAEYWRSLRTLSGLQAVGPSDLQVVMDTTVCRRAVRAFHADYDSTADSAWARSVDSGLLIKAGSNRNILAVTLFNPWSKVSFTVFDSTFRIVRWNM
jgi:hypothetical protein